MAAYWGKLSHETPQQKSAGPGPSLVRIGEFVGLEIAYRRTAKPVRGRDSRTRKETVLSSSPLVRRSRGWPHGDLGEERRRQMRARVPFAKEEKADAASGAVVCEPLCKIRAIGRLTFNRGELLCALGLGNCGQ